MKMGHKRLGQIVMEDGREAAISIERTGDSDYNFTVWDSDDRYGKVHSERFTMTEAGYGTEER